MQTGTKSLRERGWEIGTDRDLDWLVKNFNSNFSGLDLFKFPITEHGEWWILTRRKEKVTWLLHTHYNIRENFFYLYPRLFLDKISERKDGFCSHKVPENQLEFLYFYHGVSR